MRDRAARFGGHDERGGHAVLGLLRELPEIKGWLIVTGSLPVITAFA